MEVGEGVLAAVAGAVGAEVELRGRTALGESGTTFLLGDDLVLKVVPDRVPVPPRRQMVR